MTVEIKSKTDENVISCILVVMIFKIHVGSHNLKVLPGRFMISPYYISSFPGLTSLYDIKHNHDFPCKLAALYLAICP